MSKHEEHERALIRAFILPARQERYLELLVRPERRKDILSELPHFKHLDMRWAVPVPHGRPKTILEVLEMKGSPKHCHALSEDSDLDGKELQLLKALEEIHGRGIGTFPSCIAGKLAYFEDEDQRWILERAAAPNLR